MIECLHVASFHRTEPSGAEGGRGSVSGVRFVRDDLPAIEQAAATGQRVEISFEFRGERWTGVATITKAFPLSIGAIYELQGFAPVQKLR